MVVKDYHVRDFYKLAEKSGKNAMEYLFKEILPSGRTINQEFIDYLLTTVAKTRITAELTPSKAKSLLTISRVVLWVLGPIWIANNFSLPEVSLDKFKRRISNEERTDWDEYFSQFGKFNVLWQECINDSLGRLESLTDKVIAGRIIRFFLEALDSPLTTETEAMRPTV